MSHSLPSGWSVAELGWLKGVPSEGGSWHENVESMQIVSFQCLVWLFYQYLQAYNRSTFLASNLGSSANSGPVGSLVLYK